jgi:outer membrane lipopolysaccharide assembly protein LptE/RlpB
MREGLSRSAACWALAALLALLSGCGYRLQAESGPLALPEDVRSLAIVKVENPSLTAWLGAEIRSRLRDQITERGRIRWAEPDKAAGLLSVTVERFILSSEVKGGKDQTLKYQARLLLRAKIVDRNTQRVVWRSGLVNVSQPYFEDEKAGAESMVVELGVRELVDRLTQNY